MLPALPIKEPSDNRTATFTWVDVNEMVAAGWSINNHSWKHGDTTPANRYWDRLSDIKKAEQLFFDRAGYRTLVGTTPAAKEGFAFTFGILGYFCYNSTHNEYGQVPTVYGTADIAHTPTTFFNLDRSYEGDAYTSNQALRMKASIDEAWADAKNGKKTFHNAFTHGPGDWQNFDSVTGYMLNNPTVTDSQNKIWLAGVQEYFEYRHTATVSNITYNVYGEDLTITIDQTGIMDNVRDRSISLLCNGLTLSSITSVSGGQGITFNSSTGLIKLHNIDTTRLKNPSTDVLPAQIVSVTGTGSNVTVNYDQAVNQIKMAGFSIADKTFTSLTGSGNVWNVGFNSSVSDAFLSYKSNFIDVVSLSTGKKVCDYISYPIL